MLATFLIGDKASADRNDSAELEAELGARLG